ncbi:MAG: sigma-54-dependent Fis family transcriptional regulator [Treponema sp. GWC1_61_84]|nr:MAG: sigma-54-dependent Fis family transcriptional regulator [Treponema sp. GWC1_61_84]
MRTLVVDDEKNLRESLSAYLATEGIDCLLASTGEQARDTLAVERVDAVIVDLRMPGMSGLDFLSWLREAGPAIPAIMISAHGEIADAVEAMKRGAADYLVKPFDPDELVLRLRKAVRDSALVRAARAAQVAESSARGAEEAEGDEWIGAGATMAELRALAEKVAPTNSTVLVTGESGTGKEVLARHIHRLSLRSDGPFVPINLGGIPESLLESELFGHERGAFTGADSRKMGLFELAAGGTLFLDEVGDMPLALQVKLLRVLQDKRIMRLGAVRQIPIDARIVAATNKDLEAAVRSGAFREDLFYRLNVIRLRIPPLRERKEDIPGLMTRFVARFAREMGKSARRLDDEALALVLAYPFPGNVRELENAVERAVILSDGETLGARDFSFAGALMGAQMGAHMANPHEARSAAISAPASRSDGIVDLRELEKRAIEAALERNGGHRERSAAELGITRRTLLNKMNDYGLR